ncbi:MAG: GNAT family N-acetyltransferase [Candidatus Thermoplasmatota archaeon]|nr:GNAT family N-acetyltransferase [Candidatus Thermoplasmatota archaeon]
MDRQKKEKCRWGAMKSHEKKAVGIVVEAIDRSRILDLLVLWEQAGLPCRPMGRDMPSLIEKEIESNPSLWIGAWDGRRLVGAVFASDDGRKGWINRLAIHPDYRGRGIAGMLVRRAEEELEKRGREVLAVLIEDYNKESMEIFNHLGYARENEIFYFTKRKRPEA